jgi:hypothetical protein
VNGASGRATLGEIAAAVVSTGIATVATFARSGGLAPLTTGTFIFVVLGFTSLGMSRELAARGDPRATARRATAAGSFVIAAAAFLLGPALG